MAESLARNRRAARGLLRSRPGLAAFGGSLLLPGLHRAWPRPARITVNDLAQPQKVTRRPVASRNAGVSREPVPAWDRAPGWSRVPLALIVVAAFIPALDNGFVDWDDDRNFLETPITVVWAGPGEVGLEYVLARRLPAPGLVALRAQYVFWKLDPRGYHLISLLLHAANAVVLYVLTVTLLVRCRPDSFLKSPWTCALGAGLATALFAVHPLRVEAVAWASCQPYLPCALFSMLAVLAYLRAVGIGPSPRWGWLVGSFVLFVAALLSKAVAVSLPAVLLILDVYPLRRLGGGPGRWFGPSARKVWWRRSRLSW